MNPKEISRDRPAIQAKTREGQDAQVLSPIDWALAGSFDDVALSYPMSTTLLDMTFQDKVTMQSLKLMHFIFASVYFRGNSREFVINDRVLRSAGCRGREFSIGDVHRALRVLVETPVKIPEVTRQGRIRQVPTVILKRYVETKEGLKVAISKRVSSELLNPQSHIYIDLSTVRNFYRIRSVMLYPHIVKIAQSQLPEEQRFTCLISDVNRWMNKSPVFDDRPNRPFVPVSIDELRSVLGALAKQVKGLRVATQEVTMNRAKGTCYIPVYQS